MRNEAAVPQNPPMPPAGWRFMPQASVTPAMTARAVAILNDPKTYPGPTAVVDPAQFWHAIEVIDGVTCMFYVMWHEPDPPVGPDAWHRGVSIFLQNPQPQPAPTHPEGIDLSRYQGRPDWSVIKTAKSFAFIKATEGTSLVDASFVYNFASARAVGIARGAYHFFRPGGDPAAQAALFCKTLTSGTSYDPHVDLPPVLDVEVTDGMNSMTLTKGVSDWIDYVTATLGVRPVIYTSPGFWNAQVTGQIATAIAAKADLWVAHWNVSAPSIPRGWTNAAFWQYSASAAVPGVAGNMDVDRFMAGASIADWIKARAITPAPPAPAPAPTPPFAFDLSTVRGVQSALNALGYKPPLQVDGIQGPLTNAAIAVFKAACKNGPLA